MIKNIDTEIQWAEESLSAYYEQHYGPTWGDENEIEVHKLATALFELYEAAKTPADDRVAGLEHRPTLAPWLV